MSNSNRDPKDLPPDDFSMTTPGIRFPKGSSSSSQDEPVDDWAKTNYNFSPKQSPPADEWGKTAVNINAPRHRGEDDFDKTLPPGQPRRESNFDATQANINLPRESYDRGGDDFGSGREPEHKATMPYFQLPENERAKYQNLPPTAPAPQTQAEKKEKKGGLPGWLLAAGGLAIMFLFALGVLGLVYFVFLKKTDFELTVKGVPAGSDILVNNVRWSLSSQEPGTYKLTGLKINEQKVIDIKVPGFTCQQMKVTSENSEPKELVAQCTPNQIVTTTPNDCQNIKKGDFAKAAKCANDALGNLPDPFTIQQLLDAMNMYIINFPSGKYDIVKPEDKAFLQRAAGYIQKLPPNVMIEVGGHTDNVGPKDKNQTLSENRAKSVKTALVGFGVKDSVLQTRGYGDAKPKAPNDTEDGKFQNRRIEYKAILQ